MQNIQRIRPEKGGFAGRWTVGASGGWWGKLTKPKTLRELERVIRLTRTETRSRRLVRQQSGILDNGRKPDLAILQPDDGVGRKRSASRNSVSVREVEIPFNVGASKRGQTDGMRQTCENWV